MVGLAHIQRLFLKLTILLLLCLLTACNQTRYGVVKIISIPPGAEVINLKDDTHLGMTPLLVTWEDEDDAAKNETVELRKPGYVEEITTFWVNMRHETKEAAILEPQPVTIELRKRK